MCDRNRPHVRPDALYLRVDHFVVLLMFCKRAEFPTSMTSGLRTTMSS
jgi:hypothetical protein